MPLTEVPVETFGGMNLITDQGEVGATGAIDLLNVDFDQLGRVKSRQGYERHTITAGLSPYDSLHPCKRASGADIVLAGAGSTIASIISGGVSQTVTTNGSPHSFASYGTATETRVYIANGVDTVRYYTDDSFTTPTYTGVTPTGKFLATQQPDNRLVVARSGAQRSRVWFSDAGNPHAFGVNNYVDLSPGDGEEITALVSWRENVFAFKKTKFYIFYGNDTDLSGNPIFNVRGIYGAGVRLGATAVAATDGVYFLDRRGVYKTSGGNPALISRNVEPLFAPVSDTSSSRIAGASGALPAMRWADDRLYIAYSTAGATNDRVLVYHCTDGWWSSWGVPAASMTVARVSATDPLEESLLFGYASGSNHIGRFSNVTTDDAAQIASYYQFGFMDYGDSTRKVLHDSMLDGNGVVNVAVATNYGTLDTGQTVVMPAGAAGRGRARQSYRGHNFSPRISSVSGSSWRVNRFVSLVRSKNPIGIE